MIQGFGDLGLSLALSAVGSGIGVGVAGMAAIGSWKRAYQHNKAAPFLLMAFVGAPLTQTIYGFILKNQIKAANLPPESYLYQVIVGAVAGSAIGVSAWMQGKAAASACDALAETGKGFGNYIMVLGIIETIAIFTLVFTMTTLPKLQ